MARIARDAGRASGVGRGHDGEPILFLGPAGDRHGRASDHPARAWTRPSAAALESISHDAERSTNPNPWMQERLAGNVHGDGRHRRSGGQALQDQPAGAG